MVYLSLLSAIYCTVYFIGAFLKRLKEEHTAVQMERNKVSEEIEFLTESIMTGKNHAVLSVCRCSNTCTQ